MMRPELVGYAMGTCATADGRGTSECSNVEGMECSVWDASFPRATMNYLVNHPLCAHCTGKMSISLPSKSHYNQAQPIQDNECIGHDSSEKQSQ